MGPVDDLTAVYRDAALVINPVVAGTGAKIKTLEALSCLRRVVTWPAGVDGLDTRLAARCVVARDWYEFSNAVVDNLTASSRRFDAADRAEITELVSAQTVYAALDVAYQAYFERHRPRSVGPGATPDVVTAPAVTHAD
jgi:hypothetical protein